MMMMMMMMMYSDPTYNDFGGWLFPKTWLMMIVCDQCGFVMPYTIYLGSFQNSSCHLFMMIWGWFKTSYNQNVTIFWRITSHEHPARNQRFWGTQSTGAVTHSHLFLLIIYESCG